MCPAYCARRKLPSVVGNSGLERLNQVVRMLGVTPAARLPARTLETIARQDAWSEVLLRLIPLATVLFFGALFVLAPKTDGGTAFSPVPTLLASSVSMTLLGLVWAWRFGLPDWAG